MKMMFAALLACATCVAADVIVDGVSFNPAEERAVLLAAREASFEKIHYQFDIDKTTTNNIIAARPIRDLASLAAVDGVQSTVLGLLKMGVSVQCVTPASGGKYNGVTFTDAEAARALAAANHASYKVLVRMADLYPHKVQDLMRSRPVCHMSQLRKVPGFGYTPLRLLKEFTADPRRCYSNNDCTAPSRCYGIPHDGVLSSGKCETVAVLEGAACGTKTPCPSADYVCVGYTWGEGQGTCKAAWFGGSFKPLAKVAVVKVPEVGVKASTFFAVSGLASVPVDVVLHLDASVSQPTGLKIVVTDPNGAPAVYYDGKATPTEPIPASKRLSNSGDDTINGEWKVTVTNSGSASGTITSFVLDLTSRWD